MSHRPDFGVTRLDGQEPQHRQDTTGAVNTQERIVLAAEGSEQDEWHSRPGQEEGAEMRANRRWGELLQELRVAQTAVQILFGFLLALVFQPAFRDLSEADQLIYVVTTLLGAATTGALVGPVSFHRLVTGRRMKPQIVVWASRMTLVGLVLLLCTVTSALLLVLRVALDNTLALFLAAGIVAWFILCWFVLPVWARITQPSSR